MNTNCQHDRQVKVSEVDDSAAWVCEDCWALVDCDLVLSQRSDDGTEWA